MAVSLAAPTVGAPDRTAPPAPALSDGASTSPGAIPVSPEPPFAMVRAVAGWVGLGAIGLATRADVTAVGTAYTLAAPAGALLLTVPALLVGHQYLSLHAPPAALVSTLLRGFCRSGDVALGMVPIALLFATTSSLGPVVLVLTLLGACLQGLLVTMRALSTVEAGHTPSAAWTDRGRMALLVAAWGGLYALIGLRLTWNLLSLVFA